MITDPVRSHFGNWGAVLIWIVFYGLFIAFLPFYKKSKVKPGSAYLAFVIAFALEMFGLPFGMYAIAAVVGHNLPDGVLWGHTLQQYIGLWGMYAGIATSALGGLLVFFGWRAIYKNYWSKERGEGKLVTEGIYRYIRHPQYTGFFLITLGMQFEWATLPLLLMWPILLVVYTRLARREEREIEAEFGQAYRDYRARTGMFLPRLVGPRTAARTPAAGKA